MLFLVGQSVMVQTAEMDTTATTSKTDSIGNVQPPYSNNNTIPIPPETPSPTTANFIFNPSDFGFSIGLGINCLMGDQRDIIDTRLENGTVIITHEESVNKSLWLETNYTFAPIKGYEFVRPGAFFAVQVDNNFANSLSSVAGGFLLACKRPNQSPNNERHSLNFGIGVSNTRIQVLHIGIRDNRPLPDGLDEIIYKQKNVWGIIGLISFRIF